jgi:hypothetical protein
MQKLSVFDNTFVDRNKRDWLDIIHFAQRERENERERERGLREERERTRK